MEIKKKRKGRGGGRLTSLYSCKAFMEITNNVEKTQVSNAYWFEQVLISAGFLDTLSFL